MIVLDASAWLDILVGTAEPPDPEDEVVVPPHFDAEVLGSLRVLEQRGQIAPQMAAEALRIHLSASFDMVRDPSDLQQAWLWRDQFSVSDAWCIALASRLGIPWITSDGRAARRARDSGIDAREPGTRT